MPYQVRERYEQLRGKCDDAQLDRMIAVFDEGQRHPDKQDLLKANVFTDTAIRKIPAVDEFSKLRDII